MFEKLGRLAATRFVWVILAWVAIAGVVRTVAPPLRDVATYDETAFLTADAESVRAAKALLYGWPEDEFGNSAAIVISRDAELTDADLRYVDELEAWLRSDGAPDVVRGTQSAKSAPELESVLNAEDGTTTLMIVQFSTPPFEPPTTDAVIDIRKHIDQTDTGGLAVHVTGNAGVASDQDAAIRQSVERTTVVTLILVILILLWVYRSAVTPLVPLVTIGIALVVAQGIVALLAQAGMRVSSLVETFMVVIIFGAGTDYCLFVISRFREEVGSSREYRATLISTIAVVGAVIASSAGTVIVGFTAQGVAKFGMFRTVGPAMAVAVLVTLVAGLTLTPALMRAFGRNLFWPAHPERLAAAGTLPELQVSIALGLEPQMTARTEEATPPASPPPIREPVAVPGEAAPEPEPKPASRPAPRPRISAPRRTVAAKRPPAAKSKSAGRRSASKRKATPKRPAPRKGKDRR